MRGFRSGRRLLGGPVGSVIVASRGTSSVTVTLTRDTQEARRSIAQRYKSDGWRVYDVHNARTL